MTGPVWAEGIAPEVRPALRGAVRADVCVVGLGGSGLTAVEELRARGASVVGLDAGSIAGGAAGRNGGFLLAGAAHPHHRVARQLGPATAAAIHRRTLEELDRVLARTPAAARRTGSLRVEDTAEGLEDCAAQRDALRADGFAVEDYDGPEGRGLLFPDDAVAQPYLRCRLLAQGVPGLYEHSPVRRISTGRVETEHGEVRCGSVLVAVDGRLEVLLPELEGTVRTVRLQMLATEPVPLRFPRPVYLREGYEYWQQLPDGRIALGGFRDRGGAEEETRDATPTARVQGALDGLLRRRLGVEAAVTHRWAASVGYTATGFPFVGQVRPGVWAAGGYCGTGNLVGALCGRALAAAVTGGDPRELWPLA